MTTGLEFARVPNKRLLSAEDMQVRILGYLQELSRATTKAHWNVDGVFDSRLTLSGAADTVTVNGTSLATDGEGHLLDVTQIYDPDSIFENAVGITYYVAFKYAEAPKGIIVNPRTGLPEYISTQELIGEMATPTSVVDNGGTITFNVNSVTEAGVTNAGRTVRVYKVTPDPDALTEAIAIEDCTVSFSAGNNTITTTGTLGQSTVSTTAADYVVVLLGASVKRNTDTEATAGYFHIGTVVGVGSPGVPTVFDNSSQRILKSFDDATQNIFTPYGWLGSMTVQDALEEVVDDLGDTSSGTPGAIRVGVYGAAFTSATLSGAAPRFGIGNIVDGTLSAPVDLQEVLVAIDTALRRRHDWLVVNDADVTSLAADHSEVFLDNSIQSYNNIFLRQLADAANNPYQIGTDIASGDRGAQILGEFKDPDNASEHLKRTRILVAGGTKLAGKFQRVYLDASAGSGMIFGSSTGRYGSVLDDVGINGGSVKIEPISDLSDGPIRLLGGTVIPKSEATKAYASSLQIGEESGAAWAILQGVCLYGPSATQTSPATPKGAINLHSALSGSIVGTTQSAQSKPLVVRDSVFIQQRTDTPLLVIESDHKIVFDNCHFYGIVNYAAAEALIKIATGSNVVFRDCIFWDPEGLTLRGQNISGHFENCTFVCGVGGNSTIANPKILDVSSTLSSDRNGLRFVNTSILIGSAAIRTNTTANLVDLNNEADSIHSDMEVDGLKIYFIGGTTLPNLAVLKLNSSTERGMSTYRDIAISCNGLALPSTSTQGLVITRDIANRKSMKVDGLRVSGLANPAADLAVSIIKFSSSCWVKNIHFTTPLGVTGRYSSYVEASGSHIDIEGIHFDTENAMRLIEAPIWLTGTGVRSRLSKVSRNEDYAWTFGGTAPTASVLLVEASKWDISGFEINIGSSIPRHTIIDGSDNSYHDNNVGQTGSIYSIIICLAGATNYRNSVCNNNITYDGSISGGVIINSEQSLVDGNTFQRLAGSTAPIGVTGADSVIGTNTLNGQLLTYGAMSLLDISAAGSPTTGAITVNVWVALPGAASRFAKGPGDNPQFWSLDTTSGVLTYSGPEKQFMIIGSVTLYNTPAGLMAFGIDHNGDIIGTTDNADFEAQMNVANASDRFNLTVTATLKLASGDTLRGAIRNLVDGNPMWVGRHQLAVIPV